jgi:hypothetical protein
MRSPVIESSKAEPATEIEIDLELGNGLGIHRRLAESGWAKLAMFFLT